MPLASFAASAALVATPSFGAAMPYASQTSLPSGAVSDVRPSALTLSSIVRTAVLSYAIGSFLVVLDRARGAQRGDLILRVAELRQNFVGVLAQQRRAHDIGGAVRHLDRVA